MIWGLTWDILVGWLNLIGYDWHGLFLAVSSFQLAGFSWLWLALADSGCNWRCGWKSEILDFISMPIGPKFGNWLAQCGAHLCVDLRLNVWIMLGVRINAFHSKSYGFFTFMRSCY